jgi:chromosome segregation ATPase
MGVGGLPREESVVRSRNESLTREELEQRIKEIENQLQEERIRRIWAEDKLKTREGLEDRVKDIENELRKERLMRIELDDKVKGAQDEIRELKENMSTLQHKLART